MTVARRAAALVAAAVLVGLLLASSSVSEIRRRLLVLSRFAPRELAIRRLGGSAAAFDRRYDAFLERIRRRLPANAPGVILLGTPREDRYLHLAAYTFAPLPVRLAAGRPPAGWFVAAYGPAPSGAAPVRDRFPEGSLEGPVP